MPEEKHPKNTSNSKLKLTARTMTFFHPDTPLNEFIHTDFHNLRIICDHITVVGDRKYFALSRKQSLYSLKVLVLNLDEASRQQELQILV